MIYNSIPYFGTIYYFTIPFFIVGFINCLKNFYNSLKEKKFNIENIFIFWFFCVIICQLIISQPNINKANSIFVPIIYFSASGIVNVSKKLKNIIIPITLLLLLNFGLFFNYYFSHYNDDTMGQYFFATYYLDALEYSQNLGKTNIYIENDLTAQEYIYILLNNFVSPYEYDEKNIETYHNSIDTLYTIGIPDQISLDATYIIGNDTELFEKFKSLKFNYTSFR